MESSKLLFFSYSKPSRGRESVWLLIEGRTGLGGVENVCRLWRTAEPPSASRGPASARLLGRSRCLNRRVDTCSPPAQSWGLQGILAFRAPSRVRRSFALFSFGREDTLEGKVQVIFRGSCKGRAAYREWKSLITPFCLGIHLPGSVLHSYLFG